MSVIGIIAEYNPFHNGHAYQISEARRHSGAAYVVAIISGDFVQRGAPALMDKYARTRMALMAGADLVLEMPAAAAVSSAETFARCGVSILNSLGVITHLSFGCESDETAFRQIMLPASRLLCEEPDSYRRNLQAALKNGRSFPQAREEALCACLLSKGSAAANAETAGKECGSGSLPGSAEAFRLPEGNADFVLFDDDADSGLPASNEDPILFDNDADSGLLRHLLRSPNNILAIEYLKALRFFKSPLIPVPVRRNGNAYHDPVPSGRYASATALRELLSAQTDLSVIRSYVPEAIFSEYENYAESAPLLTAQDFSDLMHYALLQDLSGSSATAARESDLARRAAKLCESYTDIDSFAAELKTRDRTLTSVNRFLFRRLLGIRDKEEAALSACGYAPYARILGFCRSASPLLSDISSRSRIPVITSLADAQKKNLLSVDAMRLLKADIRAASIYHIPIARRTARSYNEFRQPVIRQ